MCYHIVKMNEEDIYKDSIMEHINYMYPEWTQEERNQYREGMLKIFTELAFNIMFK